MKEEALGKVMLRGTFRIEPIKKRVDELSEKRELTRLCETLRLSRNQVYLIIGGKSNTEENTLRTLIEGLGLKWDEIVIGAA